MKKAALLLAAILLLMHPAAAACLVTGEAYGVGAAAAIVIGMFVGYLVCLAFGLIDFGPVRQADVFAVPSPMHFGMSFPIAGIIGYLMASRLKATNPAAYARMGQNKG